MEKINLPIDFEESLKAKLGNSFSDYVKCLQSPPPTSIRLNPGKSLLMGDENVPWCGTGKYLSIRPVFTLDPVFHAGAYYVQEASSMFLEQAIKQSIDLSKPLRVLDLCAAPGGKTTHLLSLLHPESLLVTNEVIRSRATILAENVQKWGCSNVIVTNNDPEDFNRLQGFFDLIVVDTPCSGEGLFRKDPEAMNEWSPANVDLCSKRQRRIVADIWPALKSNGALVYCTCTFNEKENEENIQWLSDQYNVESISIEIDSSWNIEHIQKQQLHGYRFYPHKVKGEGFFLSTFRKTGAEPEPRIKTKRLLTSPSKKLNESLQAWTTPGERSFFDWNGTIHFFPSSLYTEFEFIIGHFKIVQAGTTLATVKHDKLIPEHAAALSIELNHQHFVTIELSLQDALQYLRKDPITIQADRKGFALVTYKNLSIGWANVLDNRVNNLYPKEWRILMR